MPSKPAARSRVDITCRPLTPDRWKDLVRLFGARGACAGCWCMYWRLSNAAFNRGKGAGNRRRFGDLVRSGEVPGILAYADDQVVGWCALAPRETYTRLARSRVARPVDSKSVWSIVCFFVAPAYRKRGVMTALLEGAVRHARTRGARLVEGYPVDPEGTYPDTFAYVGLSSAFRRAGFHEVARRSRGRPIMRRRT
jgi:GNAT superfamily N-acetyltransferase